MNQEWDTDKVYSGTWWIPGVPNVSFVGEFPSNAVLRLSSFKYLPMVRVTTRWEAARLS